MVLHQRRAAEVGPVSAAELKRLATAGQLEPTDLVQAADTDKQVPAGQVKGLFAAVTTVPNVQEPISVTRQEHDLPSQQEASTSPRTTREKAAAAIASVKDKYRSNPKVASVVARVKDKFRSNPKVVLLGAGGITLAVMFACCGGVALVGLLTGKADTELTADYYPHKPGTDRAFNRKTQNLATNDGTTIDTRWRMIHKSDVTIETIGPPPFNKTQTVKYRQAGGFVELGLSDESWEPVLKIGAKPGEAWERDGRSYTFQEFTRHNGAQCAVVMEKSNYQGTKKESLYWYAKGPDW